MKHLHFYLRFYTIFGQQLSLVINKEENNTDEIIPMQYYNEEFWQCAIPLSSTIRYIQYYYLFKDEYNQKFIDADRDKIIDVKEYKDDIYIIDMWNHASFYENVFYTKPFQEILLQKKRKFIAYNSKFIDTTHEFKVKSPLLKENEKLCICGSGKTLRNWLIEQPYILQKKGNWYTIQLNLSEENFPLQYKYGVYNIQTKQFVRFEEGDNRILELFTQQKNIIIHDCFVRLPNTAWHGAGVAIPIFSLRSKNSFGVGEFLDIKLLADWANQVSLGLIQLLPILDTTVTNTWHDSYPYSIISAFALHPLYINIEKIAGKKYTSLLTSFEEKKQQLNSLKDVNYEQVMQYKWELLKKIYNIEKKEFFENKEYQHFFSTNQHWLIPYAAFCYLRDTYKTADFSKWNTHKNYNATAIKKLVSPTQKHFDEIGIYYFVQYHLHQQLTETIDYAHQKGIVIKGDLPIGVHRHSVEVWKDSNLFNTNYQAGAPPDLFSAKSQNWRFPIYNWEAMQKDNYNWWRSRLQHMQHYFDAFRIDHILGFSRIWSIPANAVEGILGHFEPAIPIHINELNKRNIPFNYDRYCLPYITDGVLRDMFGDKAEWFISFLEKNNDNTYNIKKEFFTQRAVEAYFENLPVNEENTYIQKGLYDIIANIIFFEVKNSNQTEFHFRIEVERTTSFKYLDQHAKEKLYTLYIDYFYYRQNTLWQKIALERLPIVQRATNMLVCGEDLGVVLTSTSYAMQQLAILSLQVQRMPKDAQHSFIPLSEVPYLSVVTPSTHDMSTIRAWWEENKNQTQQYFNQELDQQGEAPLYCEPWISKLIIEKHLQSPAMWAIFQLQDLLSIDENLRSKNPADERINDPHNSHHYWQYRMPIYLEELVQKTNFNTELCTMIKDSGR